MTECNICISKITKQRPLIKCPHCSFEVCRGCYQNYCLSKTTPICMNTECAHVHTIELFRDNVTMTFYNKEWKDTVKVKLFNEQEGLLFNTQQFLAHREELVNRVVSNKKQILECEYKLLEYNHIRCLKPNPDGTLGCIDFKGASKGEPEEIKRSRELIIELNKDSQDCVYKIKRMDNNFAWTPENRGDEDDDEKKGSDVEKTTQSILVMPCSSNGCRGYVSSKYTCELCNTKYCSKCRIVNDDDSHECSSGDLETVKYMKKETKPCPKCKVPISKVDGCDQMWCVGCHTAFSWRTGTIDVGTVHNPEYFAYMRRVYGEVPRTDINQPVNNNCRTTYDLLQHRLFTMIGRRNEDANLSRLRDNIFLLYRENVHLDLVIRRTYEYRNSEDHLRRLRIMYLKNYIDKETFVRKLSNIHAKIIRSNDIMGVLDMIHMSIDETIRNNLDSIEKLPKIFENVKIIKEIADEAFKKISKRWKCKEMRFNKLIGAFVDKKEEESDNSDDDVIDLDDDN